MKLNLLLIGLAALVSVQANAAGNRISSGPITVTQCGTLSGDININLSNNVYAAWDCETNASSSWAGAVSSAGQKKTRSHTCGEVLVGATTVYSNSQCNAGNVGNAVTITGSAFYAASTSGGKIQEYALGGGGAGTDCVKGSDNGQTCATALQAAITTLATP